MRRIHRFGVGAGLACALGLAMAAFAQDAPAVHDCGERTCGEWAPKGDNTCRTCKTVQCKDEVDGDAIAGTKTETECYEGHGAPPEE